MPLYQQFAGFAALGVFSVGAIGWVKALSQLRAGQPLTPLSPRRLAPWTVLDLFAVILVYGATQVGGVFVLRRFFGFEFSALEDATAEQLFLLLLVQGLGNLATGGFAVLLTTTRIGATARDLGFSLREFGRDVALGAGSFCMLAPPVLALQALLTRWYPSEHPLVMILRERMTTPLFVMGVFVAVIVAPLVEEFIFRVLLQGWLERISEHGKLAVRAKVAPLLSPPQATAASGGLTADLVPEGQTVNPHAIPPQPWAGGELQSSEVAKDGSHVPPYWPIFVSSLIFAALHAGNGPDPIPLFFLALGLGYLYRQTHRITPSMTVHFLLNGASMTILWMELTFGQQ